MGQIIWKNTESESSGKEGLKEFFGEERIFEKNHKKSENWRESLEKVREKLRYLEAERNFLERNWVKERFGEI